VDKINILCIGDSHTAGFPLYDPLYGGNPKSSYEYWYNTLLSKQFPNITFVIHNKGICGQVSGEVLRRLSNALETFRYDFIILWAGANDIAIGYPVLRIWENLWQAFKIAVENSKAFILVTIPPMNWPGIDTKIGQLNEEIRNNSNSDTYIYADAYAALVLENEDILNPIYDAGDGVHLSIDGYEQVGKVIFNQTLPLLQKIVKEK
jgi:lysophospholipase L1-like esterase